MGARGPKALPANVHLLRGNPSRKAISELTATLQPEVEVPGCPRHLLKEARKEWKRMAPQLERYGLISLMDRAAFSLYCQTWARYVYAEEQLERDHAAALRNMAVAEAKGEVYSGGDGYTFPTPSGYMTYSPYWVMSNKAQEQMSRYLATFGMNPSSRGQVSPSALRQCELFDDDQDDGAERGGFDDL